MSDNTTLPGTGDVIATDDIGGVKHQLVKIEFGAADSATPVSAANPLPVVFATAPTTPVTGSFWQTTQPVSFSWAGLTDTQLRATALPVSGTFFQATQPVSIAASVAVTGPATDAQLRATALPVSLASTAITGSVAVTGPLTDAQLRASAVPVSLASTTITGGVVMADALANPTATQVAAGNMLFNGTSWDRERGMSLATTTGDTGAKTATGSGATTTNVGSKGLQIVIVLGAVSAQCRQPFSRSRAALMAVQTGLMCQARQPLHWWHQARLASQSIRGRR